MKIRIAIYSRKSKYSDKGDTRWQSNRNSKRIYKMHFPEGEYEVEIIIYEDEGFSGVGVLIDPSQLKRFLEDESSNSIISLYVGRFR